MQLEINELDDTIFEWIPYDQFDDIKEISKGSDKDSKYSITYIGEVLRIHGISQNPNTKDYIIVFQDIYCKKCGKKYTEIIEEWCEPCQINYFKENLARSENEKIDNIIHKMQLKIKYYKSDIIFEWIPYDQLSDIQEISKHDFDIMYSATWKNGPICYNDKEWTRKSNKVVTLKYSQKSQNIIKHLNMITILYKHLAYTKSKDLNLKFVY
ncbi:unnamed protein product [Rhizophagus irregularis]|nr:unnamed protein product [Rhizophagus irregularis]